MRVSGQTSSQHGTRLHRAAPRPQGTTKNQHYSWQNPMGATVIMPALKRTSTPLAPQRRMRLEGDDSLDGLS